jgi:hypothetical protein
MSAAAQAGLWPPHVDGRTGQKVRRDSQPHAAGEGFYRPLHKATVVHIMRGAERLAFRTFRTRGKGKRRGELTLQDLNILEVLLFRFMTWSSGHCDPTYEQIQEVTGHARDTISKAIGRLKRAGILERMRRFTVVPGAEGQGPRVHQAPNAYRFSLPAKLRALLGLGGAERPIPDDAAIATRDAWLSNSRQEAEFTGKPTIGSELARLERGVNRRADES